MGKTGKKQYLESIIKRYHKSDRQTKSQILTEFCLVCGYNRKYAMHLLKKRKKPKQATKRGCKAKYQNPELLKALKTIWLASDMMCSKKLVVAIPAWLPFYNLHHKPINDDIKALLLAISSASIDRLLKPYRAAYRRKRQCGTKPGRLLKTQIPIKVDHWDVSEPGFVEADTIAHCGDSMAGDFAWSLTLTDIHSTWTEVRAIWNKGSMDVIKQISHIQKQLPFQIKGFDCDNGSEFLNHHLVRYFTKRKVKFTRSRPYHKNDNAHVEQKNWTHVKQLFGYARLDKPKIIQWMNHLYCNELSDHHNFFCPSMKLTHKQRVGAKYKKQYDEPKTPYQRLLGSNAINQETKEKLTARYLSLDPFKLSQAIKRKLNIIFNLLRSA